MTRDQLWDSISSAVRHAAPSVTAVLRDGREIDLSGKTPAEAIDLLRALGITAADIAHTRWMLGRHKPDSPK